MKLNQATILEGHRGAVYCITPYINQTKFLSAGGEGWIVAWDLEQPQNGQLLARIDSNIFSCIYLAAQNWVVAGDMYGGVHWIDLATKTNFQSLQVHKQGVFALFLLNSQLLSLGGKGNLSLWNIDKNRPVKTLQLSQTRLRAISYAQNRDELAIGSSDGYIYVLDAQTWVLKQQFKAHASSVFSIKYSPDNKYLLSGGRDAYLRIWNVNEAYKELPTEAAHLYTINAMAFHPSAAILATASRDKTIKIWSLDQFKLLKVINPFRKGHLNSVNDLWWSTFNNQLVSCSDDRTIRVWTLENLQVQ